MKRSFGVVVLVLVLVVILSSCIDAGAGGDTNSSGNGSFTYDGTIYSLEKLIIEVYGENDETPEETGYNMGVFLVSSGISYDSVADELTGTGDLVWLDLNTDNPGGLSADTYTWSGTKTIGTITDARIGTGYDIATNSGQNVEGSGGTVTISGDSAEWTIAFSLTMSDGKSVEGSYTGAVDTAF